MIIDSIKINNFGLYKGDNYFELKPNNLVNRNITVISGQNGVGKSTLQEAIHLCLLGSLSIDSRVTESAYEKHLYRRSYKGKEALTLTSSIELSFEFVKSGAPVIYKVSRSWVNSPSDPNEEITIIENGRPLAELNKKEKNLFLRELIQPGLAKVMFFDGERLLSLYDQGNLSAFIGESCRYLFGLNFVDLLHTDINYYIQKLHGQQDPSQSQAEIEQVKATLKEIQNNVVRFEAEKTTAIEQINFLKQSALSTEKLISEQGRWAGGTLEQLQAEKQLLEKNIITFKKELVEIYSSLGPFVFCRNLCLSLKERLLTERDMEQWQYAGDLLQRKLNELSDQFENAAFLKSLQIDRQTGERILPVIKSALMANPSNDVSKGKIYHEIADSERSKLITWIDDIIHNISSAVTNRSHEVARQEERLKAVNKELSSFSSEDLILPLLKELQDKTKRLGAKEQMLESLNRKTDENNKRKDHYLARLTSLEEKLLKDGNVDERLRLGNRTRLVLESYTRQLMEKKLELLKGKVLQKFNMLCRKESYLDQLGIDPKTFELTLSRKGTKVDHAHLSAGEKQLLIVSILWGLRELTNISLPLIIDTPLARLDLEHRRTFIERFLPAIQPQVILIGTDMELAGDVISGLEHRIANQYTLTYNQETQSTQITAIDRIYPERVLNEI